MAQNRTASLTVTMIDELSRPARTIEAALAQSEARIKELSAAMGEAGGSDRSLQSLNKLGATKSDVESVARSFVDYTRSAGLAADASEWTKTQAADVRAWERATVDSCARLSGSATRRRWPCVAPLQSRRRYSNVKSR